MISYSLWFLPAACSRGLQLMALQKESQSCVKEVEFKDCACVRERGWCSCWFRLQVDHVEFGFPVSSNIKAIWSLNVFFYLWSFAELLSQRGHQLKFCINKIFNTADIRH